MSMHHSADERITLEQVAQHLARCQQPRLAAAVRQCDAETRDLSRRYHDLLLEVARLQHQIEPQAPIADRVSYKSEWD